MHIFQREISKVCHFFPEFGLILSLKPGAFVRYYNDIVMIFSSENNITYANVYIELLINDFLTIIIYLTSPQV